MVFLNGLEITLISCASTLPRSLPVVQNAAVSSHTGSNGRTPSCLTVTVCVSECIYVDSVCSGQAAFGQPSMVSRQSVTVWTTVCCSWTFAEERGVKKMCCEKQQIDLL